LGVEEREIELKFTIDCRWSSGGRDAYWPASLLSARIRGGSPRLKANTVSMSEHIWF
jgi:hypothetical protein